MLHAANADAAEAAGAARAAADAGNAAEAHRARALWGLSFAAENLKSPEKYTATASPATAYASARRAREASPSDAAGALALGLCAEARGRDAEARAAFEDAEALAASAGTGPGLIAARTATFARTVAAEARLGAARLGESSSALGSADVRARRSHKKRRLHTKHVRSNTSVSGRGRAFPGDSARARERPRAPLVCPRAWRARVAAVRV